MHPSKCSAASFLSAERPASSSGSCRSGERSAKRFRNLSAAEHSRASLCSAARPCPSDIGPLSLGMECIRPKPCACPQNHGRRYGGCKYPPENGTEFCLYCDSNGCCCPCEGCDSDDEGWAKTGTSGEQSATSAEQRSTPTCSAGRPLPRAVLLAVLEGPDVWLWLGHSDFLERHRERASFLLCAASVCNGHLLHDLQDIHQFTTNHRPRKVQLVHSLA